MRQNGAKWAQNETTMTDWMMVMKEKYGFFPFLVVSFWSWKFVLMYQLMKQQDQNACAMFEDWELLR